MTTLSLLDQHPEDDRRRPAGELTIPVPDGWPAAPAAAAYHGLAGEIVGTIAPHTEADPVAILSQLLVAFGAAAGRGAWFSVEATRHHPNEFLCWSVTARAPARDLRGITCTAWSAPRTRRSAPGS